MIQKQQTLSPLQKTIRFYRTIQAGDIALFNYIQEAIFFLGYTKVGKTSSCHSLCGSPLRSQLVQGELVYRPSTKKFPAKVGNLIDSETEIPNIFQTQVVDPLTNKVKNTVVLDQPGYGDTYGFHRIFSNGYFHYRSFSKAGKIKFVLVFNHKDLLDDPTKFKSTISNFFNSFKKYENIKDSIEAATSFLVTKVDHTLSTPQLLIDKLTFLRDNAVKSMGKQKGHAFSLLTNIIQNKKAYFIKKPTQVGVSTTENIILQQIYSGSTFWDRTDEIKNNFVSMKQINFSVAKQVISKLQDDNEQDFLKDFDSFTKYTQVRLNNIITLHMGSLINIVRQLCENAKKSNQSNQFLYLMEKLNNQYYKFESSYDAQRKKRELDLFKQGDLNQSGSKAAKKGKDNQNTYFINKFKVIQYLKSLQYIYELKSAYTIEEMQQISNTFKNIFRKFIILGMNKDHQQIILQYSYIVQRLIEQYKIIILILIQDKQAQIYFDNPEKNVFTEDLARSITDRFFTQTVGQIDVIDLKIAFLQKFNFNQLSSINDEIIQFFQDLVVQKPICEKYMKNKVRLNEEETKKLILLKVSQLLKNYYKQIFEVQTPPTEKQMLKALKKFGQYRNKLYQQMNLQIEPINKKELIAHIFTITRLLANIFKKLDRREEIKDCYISISDAKSLFQTYQEQLNSQVNIKQQRALLLDYGKTAISYDRQELAKDCFQRAYTLSEECDEIMEVSKLIVKLGQKEEEQCQYILNLNAGTYCLDLSYRIQSWIVNE